MPEHKVLGILIKKTWTARIIGILYILFALLLILLGLVDLLAGLGSAIPTDGSDAYFNSGVIYMHHPSSPLLYFYGVMIMSAGIILLNNGCKLIFSKSFLQYFLRHSVLSTFLLFVLTAFQAGIFFGMRGGSSSWFDFKPLFGVLVIFLGIFLVYFILKMVFKKRAVKTYWATLPLFVILVCAMAGVSIVSHLRLYRDPEKAAEAFAGSVSEIKNSANYLFAESEDGKTNVAKLSPNLLRALIRHNVRIPDDRSSDRRGSFTLQSLDVNDNNQKLTKTSDVPQLPLPGWTPMIFLLVAVMAFVFLRIRKNYWSYLASSENMVVLFGWINLFLLYWFGVAAGGSLYKLYLIGKTQVSENPSVADSDGFVNGGILISFICAAVLISTVKSRIRSAAPIGTRRGWIAFFYFVNLFALAGVYALTNKANSNPAVPWMFCYNLVSALSCWIALYFTKQRA